GQDFDGNQEMIGIGAANIGAGFFQGFPVSTSGSRTAVAEQAGVKTQVTGLVGALAIVLMLVLVPGLLKNLPQPTPAAVVIVVAAEPITDIDTTAADMLEDLDEEINAKGVSLVFAEMKDPVRSKVERYELTRTIDPEHFYPTLTAAVNAFGRKTGADWVPDG